MSQVELRTPVKSMHGLFEKDSGIIMRKKRFRAPSGKVMKEGVQEAYSIVHPRDYKANPPKGKELENINEFAATKRLSSDIINSDKVTDDELAAMTPEQQEQIAELRTQLEAFRKRFYAQFKRPDPETPFEKKLKPGASKLRRKQYAKLDNFIQAILRERAKKADAEEGE